MGKNAWSRSDADVDVLKQKLMSQFGFVHVFIDSRNVEEGLQIFSSLGQSEFSFLDQSYFK